MEVSDVLRDRISEPAGLERMVVLSVLAHVVLGVVVMLLPHDWLSRAAPPPKTVMTISLGGGNGGPNNGGLSSISQRAVQTEAPPPPKPEPVRPPAAATPEMTVPVPTTAPPRPAARPAAKAPTPAPRVEQAPDDARGRTPTRGAERREGQAVAETGARGQGFGLSTSSGSGLGSTLDIVGEFCCPEYITLMIQRIRTNWDPRAEVASVAIVKYTIQRDGTIVDATVERSSGYAALDVKALRAVVGTRQLPPLPSAFTNPTLTVHLNFQYTR